MNPVSGQSLGIMHPNIYLAHSRREHNRHRPRLRIRRCSVTVAA
jgi:hypothetical protein